MKEIETAVEAQRRVAEAQALCDERWKAYDQAVDALRAAETALSNARRDIDKLVARRADVEGADLFPLHPRAPRHRVTETHGVTEPR